MSRRYFLRYVYRSVSLILCIALLVQASPVVAGPDPARRPSVIPSPVEVTQQPAPKTDTPVPQEPPPDIQHPTVPEDLVPPGETQLLSHQPVTPSRSGLASPSPATSIALVSGWNLVSIPEAPADPNPAVVLASLAGKYDRVAAYDACDAKPWKFYTPNEPAAENPLRAIDHRIGFWIHMTAAGTLTVSGSKPVSTTIRLCQGWNLIGYPLDRALPVAGALVSLEGKYRQLFAYDPTTGLDPWSVYDVGVPSWVNTVVQMQPGRGYWVLAAATADLVISQPGAPPTVALRSPTEGTEIVAITGVTGTVNSPVGVTWQLAYRAKDSLAWTTIVTGTKSVTNGRLGNFDPTLLLNGLYEIQLAATDIWGQLASATTAVLVSGEQKVGLFTISYVDLSIPLAGIPIQIVRTYDSRVKTQNDFGIGWTLSIHQGTYKNNRKPGDGWVIQPANDFFNTPCSVSKATKQHITEIRLSDSELYRFTLQVTMSGFGSVISGGCEGQADFTLLGGASGAKLEIIGDNDVFWPNGSSQLQFGLTSEHIGETFNPDSVRLTLADGRQFDLTLADGLQRVADANGNSIRLTANGIQHSTGQSVAFTHDALGRITRITDPLLNAISYTYDARRDLVSVTDQGGNRTQFVYNSRHDLLKIVDPRGDVPARNEYDAIGRLTAVIDATGNRIEFTHNLGVRQEVVRDRLGHATIYAYDERGNVITQINALGETTRSTYDTRGNKRSETDALGHTTSFTYDNRDNLLTQTDLLGRTSKYTYNSHNQVLTVTDPLGSVTTNTYDAQGALLATRDPLGKTTSYTYDTAGNLLSLTDSLGNTTRFNYDNRGNPIKQTDALGHVTTFTYDANGNLLTQTTNRTDASGHSVTLITRNEYDAKNRLIKITDPTGNSVRIEYDANGNRTAIVDKNGNRTTYQYDLRGQLAKTTYPDGSIETLSYDANGNRLTSTDRAGRTTRYEYDIINRLVRSIFADGSSTRIEYDATGNVAATIDANGHRTTYRRDAAGRNTQVIDALGNTTTYTYTDLIALDPEPEVRSLTDANGHTTTFEYDANGRKIKTIFPDGTSTSTAYDNAGRKIAEVDPAGHTTQFVYNALGQLTQVVDALGSKTTYTYDEVGNRLTQTDANGHTTRWDYDDLGRVVKHTLPLGLFEGFTYDANGNILTHTDFSGRVTTFTYDSNNRLLIRRYPDGTQVSYTYTPTGQVATVTDARGVTTYNYDTRDHLTRVINPNGSTIVYTYDAAGNRTSVSLASGATAYSYDALNRLSSVTDPAGGVTTYTYDKVGNRAGITYPNGIVTRYTYDAANRLLSLLNQNPAGQTISSYTYTLGPAGNRTSVVEDAGRRVDYTYDALGRLLREAITDSGAGNQSISYTYDAVGNRLTKVDASSTLTYTYDANDRLLTAGDSIYTYDSNGNTLTQLVSGVAVTYTYDYENRLSAVQSYTQTIRYVYDADGIRVGATTDGIATNYLVDKNRDFAEVLEERDSSGGLIASYIYGDDLISQQRSGVTSYYHYDGLGSTRALTNHSLNVTDRYTYDAFGNLLVVIGSTVNHYLFTGQQLDPGALFYYLRARYYNPQIGRFITMDLVTGTAFDPATLHKYLYVNADPVNKTDFSGQQFSLGSVAITSAIMGVLAGIATYSFTGSVQAAVIVGVSVFVLSFVALGGPALLASSLSGEGVATGAVGVGGAAIPAVPRLLNPTTWQQAEQMLSQVLNVAKNTGTFFVQGMSRARIPDFVWQGRFLVDSKFVQTLSTTAQIRDFVTLALARGEPLYIFVRANTYVTGSQPGTQGVLQLIRSTGGDVIRIFQ